MQTEFLTMEAGEMLESLFERLGECKCRTVPIKRGETLVGLVTTENIGEFLMIQSALKGEKPGRVPFVGRHG
jgi:hypothetical protein